MTAPRHPSTTALVGAAHRALHDDLLPLRTGGDPMRIAQAVLVPLARAGWDKRDAIRFLRKGGAGAVPVALHLATLSHVDAKSWCSAAWSAAMRVVTTDTDTIDRRIALTAWRVAVDPAPGIYGETDRLVHLALLQRAADWHDVRILLSLDHIAAVTGLNRKTVARSLDRLCQPIPWPDQSPCRNDQSVEEGESTDSTGQREESQRRARGPFRRRSPIAVVAQRPGHPNRYLVRLDREPKTGSILHHLGEPDPRPLPFQGETVESHPEHDARSVASRGPTEGLEHDATAQDAQGDPKAVLTAWLVDHFGHDAFVVLRDRDRHAAHLGPVGHHVLCVLVEHGPMRTAEVAQAVGSPLVGTGRLLALMQRVELVAHDSHTGPWSCDLQLPDLVERLDKLAVMIGTTGRAAQRARDREAQIAQRLAVVASNARYLSDCRAAEAAVDRLQDDDPWPWDLPKGDRQAAVMDLPARVIDAVVDALGEVRRARRAGEWDLDDVARTCCLVVTGDRRSDSLMPWPTGWEPTRVWVLEQIDQRLKQSVLEV